MRKILFSFLSVNPRFETEEKWLLAELPFFTEFQKFQRKMHYKRKNCHIWPPGGSGGKFLQHHLLSSRGIKCGNPGTKPGKLFHLLLVCVSLAVKRLLDANGIILKACQADLHSVVCKGENCTEVLAL
jgi:hypothetical protein